MDKSEKERLEEMTRWLRFMGIQEARGVVDTALSFDDDKKERNAKIVYQLSDGTRTSRDIEKYIDYSRHWVSDRHQDWSNVGIVERNDSQAPYEHIMALDRLGLEVPDIPEPEEDGAQQEGE